MQLHPAPRAVLGPMGKARSKGRPFATSRTQVGGGKGAGGVEVGFPTLDLSLAVSRAGTGAIQAKPGP